MAEAKAELSTTAPEIRLVSDGRPAPAGAASDEPEADHALLHRVAAGDRAAFEVLFRRFYPRVRAYLLRLLRRADLADEVGNDVMLTLWQKAGSFEGRSRLSTWILGIAYRKGLHALRREASQPALAESQDLESWEKRRHLDESCRRDLLGDLESALDALSAEQRAVVVMSYSYGYSYGEIAAITGVPENTVKTRMFYARRRLKEAWGSARRGASD